MEKDVQIAIDGPAGSGKSTIARKLAERLNLEYIDTGAMYRALTLAAITMGIAPGDRKGIIDTAAKVRIQLSGLKVFLNGEDVSLKVRTPLVDKRVSEVASIPEVRRILVRLQRQMAARGGVVMDGRDIGTSVLPEARFKFFLTATLEERAKRRYQDLIKTSPQITLEQVMNEMERRDLLDSTRGHSPLKVADDAVVIDTTGRSIEEVLDEIMSIVGG